MNTSQLDFDQLTRTAKRLATERGHNPDVNDIDAIIEDAIELLSQRPLTNAEVEAQLDLLISRDGMTCNSCGATQDCTPDCDLR